MDKKKFVEALVSACSRLISDSENLKEDESTKLSAEEVIERANEIMQDAWLDEPKTEEGKTARAMAVDMVKNPKTSPYVDRTKFNYAEYNDKTAGVAIPEILKKIGEMSENLSTITEQTEEYDDKQFVAQGDLTKAVFVILNEHKVGVTAYPQLFQRLREVITALEENVAKKVSESRTEILSHYIGVKNPGTPNVDSGHATQADLQTALEKIRAEYPDQKYFYDKRKGMME